jgi:hypothetical protein
MGMADVLEHLPSKPEALMLKPSTLQKINKERENDLGAKNLTLNLKNIKRWVC